MTAELQVKPADHEALPGSNAKPRPRVRIWPAVVMLAAFWAFELSVYSVELAMFARFVTRFAVYGLLLLVFLGWWLTASRMLWRDRLLGVLLLIVGAVVASLVADKSVAGGVVVIKGFPCVFTAWTLWLLVARSSSPAIQRVGLVAATALMLGYFTLLRWDGLDGAQRTKLSWRWSPKPEQLFLAATKSRTRAPNASDGSTAGPNWRIEDTPATLWRVQPGDWVDFRSAQRDGGLPEIDLAENWSQQPPKLIWRRRVGPAWSSMIVVDGHLVTQEQRGQSEAIVCYSASTGDEIWAHEDEGRFEEPLSGPGPRATPSFAGNRIYAVGARGKLTCLAAPTGQRVWSREILTQAGAGAPQWGLAVSPLVVDDLVIVFAGGKEGRSLCAYRANDGEPVWACAAGEVSYSSPQLATIDGERQILMIDDRGLHAVDVQTGEIVFQRLAETGSAQPMLQAHVITERELVTPWGEGVAVVEVARHDGQWQLAQRWTGTSLKPGFNDFVVQSGHIYGLDDGIMCCLDLQTGRRLWKKGRFGHGQLLLLASPPRLLVVGENGEVAVIAADERRYEELGRFQAIEGKTWNHPVIAHGCLFIRNGAEMMCYQLVR